MGFKFKLKCMLCHKEHRANKKKFPIVYVVRVMNKMGKCVERALGHVCRKCVRKARKNGGRFK